MMKSGAAAVLAIASLTSAATAQSVSQPACAFQHCVGPEVDDNNACCAGTRCVQKNEHYAQCLPNNMPIPALWTDGSVILEKSPGGVVPGGAAGDVSVGDSGTEALLEDDTTLPTEDGDVLVVDDKDVVLGVPATTDEALELIEDGDYEYVESPIEIPDAMLDISYMAFVGRDYHPLQETASSVGVTDLPNGSYNASSPQECEDLCTVTTGCNAASYYLNGEAFDGVNCWLKTLADACGLPADASFDDNAVYLIQIDETCPEFALAPEEALAPMADFPLSAGEEEEVELTPPAETPNGPTFTPNPRLGAATPTVPITTTEDRSNAAAFGGVLFALAAAGAVAFF